MTRNQLTDAAGSGSPNRGFALPVDQIGVWTSTACVIHCLLTPVVLSISAVSAHFLPSEERTHRTLAVAIAALGPVRAIRCVADLGSCRNSSPLAAALLRGPRGAFLRRTPNLSASRKALHQKRVKGQGSDHTRRRETGFFAEGKVRFPIHNPIHKKRGLQRLRWS